jgi:hypothetical protein
MCTENEGHPPVTTTTGARPAPYPPLNPPLHRLFDSLLNTLTLTLLTVHSLKSISRTHLQLHLTEKHWIDRTFLSIQQSRNTRLYHNSPDSFRLDRVKQTNNIKMVF